MHTVTSVGFLFTLNYDARNHELKTGTTLRFYACIQETRNSNVVLRVQPIRCSFSLCIYSCKTLYMFQTVFPSIIRSSKLHIQRQVFVRPLLLDCVSNMMAHAQKPDFVFRRNGRVHLNRRGRQFSRLLAVEMCGSAVVMLDTPCSEVM